MEDNIDLSSVDIIKKYDKKTLEKICRNKKLKISGNKQELQERIMTDLGLIEAPEIKSISEEIDLSSVEVIKKYDKKKLEIVCKKRNLKVSGKKEELQNRIFESLGFQKEEKKSLEDFDVSLDKIYSYDKKTLEAICKLRDLKISGKKEELQNRILENCGIEVKEQKIEEKSKSKSGKSGKSGKSKNVKKSSPSVIKKLEEVSFTYTISRNKWGNYEHPDTKLVFETGSGCVIGIQNNDGTVTDITSDEIEICKKYKFKYRLPLNLSSNNNEDEEKIEELEEIKDNSDSDEEYEEENEVIN